MSKTIYKEYNNETVEEIIEKYKHSNIITFSTGGSSFTNYSDYKYYPEHPEHKFRKWSWYEGEYHFEGNYDDIPSLSMINHIAIFNSEGSMEDWETIVIKNPNFPHSYFKNGKKGEKA